MSHSTFLRLKFRAVQPIIAVSFGFLAALAPVEPAHGAEILVTPNRGYANDVFLVPGFDTARTFLQSNRSYACVIIVREFDSALPKRYPVFNVNLTAPDATMVTASAIGAVKPGIGTPASRAAQQALLRIGLVAPQTGFYTISFLEGQPGGTAVPGSSVRCDDTTLYGGFNRFFAEIPIVELTNNTFQDISANITIIDFDGNVLIPQQAVFVPADNRADVIFAGLPEQRFGQILVTSVGSLGALSGYVSEYDQAPDGALTLKRERALSLGAALP